MPMFANRNVVASHSKRYHHEGNLRDGRERKHALDIDLAASNYCCIECCDSTYDSNEVHRSRYLTVAREHAGYEVDTCHDHGSGVDKC